MSVLHAGTEDGRVVLLGAKNESVSLGSEISALLRENDGSLLAASVGGVIARLSGVAIVKKATHPDMAFSGIAPGRYDGAPVLALTHAQGISLCDVGALAEINLISLEDARPSCITALGQWLVVGSEEGFLRRLDIDADEREPFMATESGAAISEVCSLSGTFIAALRADDVVAIYDAADTDRASNDRRVLDRKLTALCALPDGRALVADDTGALWAIEPKHDVMEELHRTAAAGLTALAATADLIAVGTDAGEVLLFSRGKGGLTRMQRFSLGSPVTALAFG